MLDSYRTARSAAGPGAGPRRRQALAGETELLEVFADLSELTRNRRGPDTRTDTQVHSPREYFHSYLQSLDAERAGLPEAFQHRLSQVLGHYGVTGLDRTPELEDAVFRIFLAQRRAASDAAVVTALLRQWLTEPPPGEPLRERAGLTLEHLIAATQLRFPAVADLARSVVFRWFAQPLLRRTRAQVYAAVRKHLSYLDAHPDAPDRGGADRRAWWPARSRWAAARAADRPPGRRAAPMLEVLTRRYYGSRACTACERHQVAGRTVRQRRARGETGRSAVLATAVDFPALPDAVRAIDGTAPQPATSVADIYLHLGRPAATTRTRWRPSCAACWPPRPLPSQLRRVTTTVAGRSGAIMHHHFTFRPIARRESPKSG